MFSRWIKRRGEGALDELCRITKNAFERNDKQMELAHKWEKAKGDRKEELSRELEKLHVEEVDSWDKENKLLKRVLKEKWAKEQIEQQLNEMDETILTSLLRDGITLEILNLEEPQLKIVSRLPSGKLPDNELKLLDSGRFYKCRAFGISKFGANCALVYVEQRLRKKLPQITDDTIEKWREDSAKEFVKPLLEAIGLSEGELLKKRLEERIKVVIAVDSWVTVIACDKYCRMSSENIISGVQTIFSSFPESEEKQGGHIHSPFPTIRTRIIEQDGYKFLVEDEATILLGLTQEEIQILLKEGFECKVDVTWDGDLARGIWGRKYVDKKEAKDEAKRIKKLLGW